MKPTVRHRHPTTTLDPAVAACTDQATQHVIAFWRSGDTITLVRRYGYGSTSIQKSVDILKDVAVIVTPEPDTAEQILAGIPVLAAERCEIDPAFREDVLAEET